MVRIISAAFLVLMTATAAVQAGTFSGPTPAEQCLSTRATEPSVGKSPEFMASMPPQEAADPKTLAIQWGVCFKACEVICYVNTDCQWGGKYYGPCTTACP